MLYMNERDMNRQVGGPSVRGHAIYMHCSMGGSAH